MKRHGWFVIPGVQHGDRTLEDQRRGLEPAFDEVRSGRARRVLDLGCAEALLSREFALAGAEVLGVEILPGHIEVARRVCKDAPTVRLQCANALDFIEAERAVRPMRRFDIVLALGICHKVHDPAIALRYVAEAAGGLLCFRNAGLARKTGIVKAKHGKGEGNAWRIFAAAGLQLEQVQRSSRDEAVEYWRRRKTTEEVPA